MLVLLLLFYVDIYYSVGFLLSSVLVVLKYLKKLGVIFKLFLIIIIVFWWSILKICDKVYL